MDKPRLQMRTAQTQSQKQTQRLMMSNKMQQALSVLQLPALEMAQMIAQEMEQNPILELIEETSQEQLPIEEEPAEKELSFDEKDLEVFERLDEDFRDLFSESGDFYKKRTQEDEKRKSFLDQSIRKEPSLFEYLMEQACQVLEPKLRPVAEVLIGSFDENGFLNTPLEEVAEFHGIALELLQKVLKEIQQLDPPGVGAVDLKESLLLQLRRKLKEDSLAYFIIEGHYDDLLNNRLPKISEKLAVSSNEVRLAIDEHIARLDLHPGAAHSRVIPQTITPDVTIRQEGDDLVVDINNDYIPSLRLNHQYMKMLKDNLVPEVDKEFIKEKVLSAKWLMKNLYSRGDTVERIARELAKTQRNFFLDPKGELLPSLMKTLAQDLELHESTIARAVANKYVDTPRGIFPLRFFFTNSYETSDGMEISQNTVQNLLKEIVDKEDKEKPLSDDMISKMMLVKGVTLARRTVAKLRNVLKLGNARQRKKHR